MDQARSWVTNGIFGGNHSYTANADQSADIRANAMLQCILNGTRMFELPKKETTKRSDVEKMIVESQKRFAMGIAEATNIQEL